jgi:beta-lactamase class A
LKAGGIVERRGRQGALRNCGASLLAAGALVGSLAALDAPGAVAGPNGAQRRGPLERAPNDPFAIPRSPFRSKAMRAFLSGRAGNISAAVEDIASGRIYLYHPDDREMTASIVKVDILATLLDQTDRDGESLSGDEDAVATGMIEQSDNDDATTLWDTVGGAPAVAAFDARLRMTQTTPELAWGLTLTTARDQIYLLRHVALRNRILPSAARRYELNLMENVVSDQHWGVSAGPPPGVTVALKNGWLPTANAAWQVNSIGYVHGKGRGYLIALLTNGLDAEGYEIDTIEGISQIVWSKLRDHRLPPSPPTGSTGLTGSTGPSGASGASGGTAQTGAT